MTDATQQPISIEEVGRHLDQDQFWSLRAHAIQHYASLEQSLCGLFASLGGMPLPVAGIIFFKISSADSRRKIIHKLYKYKHQQTYNLFMNSLIDQLRPIDQRRNEIVHWNTAQTISGPSPSDWSISLIAPNSYVLNENSDAITAADFVAFTHKCSFYSRLINMFNMFMHPPQAGLQDILRGTWQQIFAQPIAYPPPVGHPLLPTRPAP